MRLLLVLVVAALACTLLWWLPSGNSNVTAAGPDADGAKTATDLRVAEPVEDHKREATPRVREPEAAGILLSGTISVRGSDGREHSAEDGKFVLKPWLTTSQQGGTGPTGDDIAVEVEAGRWAVRVPRKAMGFLIGGVELGGRPVEIDEDQVKFRKPLPPEPRFELRGHWIDGARLRVVDAETNADLQAVIVVHASGWPRLGFAHPVGFDSKDVVVKNVASPFVLSPKTSSGVSAQGTYWIGASGYAWSRVKLLHTEPGERKVPLHRAGRLALRIAGERVPPNAVLRFYRVVGMTSREDGSVSGSSLFHLDVGQTRRHELGGLVPGGFQVQLTKGRLDDEPTVYATARGIVKARETTNLVLNVRKWSAPPIVAVAGTLHVPKEWGVTRPRLEFDPLGDVRQWVQHELDLKLGPANRMQTAGDYRWNAGKLPVGSYQVIVHPLDVRRRIDIDVGGDTFVRLVAPHPADVEVEVVDSVTNAVLPKANLTWHTELPEGVESWMPRNATWDAEKKLYRWRAPVGKLLCSVHPEGYLYESRDLTVHRGLNRLRIPCGRICGIEILLESRGTKLPWDNQFLKKLKAQGHDGKATYWWRNRVAVTKPGDYVLSLESTKGFKKVKSRVVVIEWGKWTKVVIELERQK